MLVENMDARTVGSALEKMRREDESKNIFVVLEPWQGQESACRVMMHKTEQNFEHCLSPTVRTAGGKTKIRLKRMQPPTKFLESIAKTRKIGPIMHFHHKGALYFYEKESKKWHRKKLLKEIWYHSGSNTTVKKRKGEKINAFLKLIPN